MNINTLVDITTATLDQCGFLDCVSEEATQDLCENLYSSFEKNAAEIAIAADERIEELEKALQDLIWATSANSLSDVILSRHRASDVLHNNA